MAEKKHPYYYSLHPDPHQIDPAKIDTGFTLYKFNI